jgi:hypothetical protein
MSKFIDMLTERIDIFGQSTQLNVNGKSQYTSKIGALFSLITVALSVGYGMTLLLKTISRSDP